MERNFKEYENCRLCPRVCCADRRIRTGLCGLGSTLRAARAGLHYYEEPFLSGNRGSGTVFFSGCSLGCVYCQNGRISKDLVGMDITVPRLADIFLEQQERGAHNLNLVTGTHFTPSIAEALRMAKSKGLCLPVIWNSSGYEKPETLRLLDGLVDIFLPDFKTLSPELGRKYLHAEDYPIRAKEALACMIEMTGETVFTGLDGEEAGQDRDRGSQEELYEGEGVLMKHGVVVRHLVIPGQTEDSRAVLRYLYETYGNRIWISLMSQYTPVGVFAGFPELSRTVTPQEYDEIVEYAITLGVENCMIQEGDVATDSFIPSFDGSGIVK